MPVLPIAPLPAPPPVACVMCGTLNAKVRYCASCGTPLDAPPPSVPSLARQPIANEPSVMSALPLIEPLPTPATPIEPQVETPVSLVATTAPIEDVGRVTEPVVLPVSASARALSIAAGIAVFAVIAGGALAVRSTFASAASARANVAATAAIASAPPPSHAAPSSLAPSIAAPASASPSAPSSAAPSSSAAPIRPSSVSAASTPQADAPPHEAAPTTDGANGTASAPAASADIPPGMGLLKTSDAAPGRRVFLDGRVVGQTPRSILVKCGPARIKIGSAGQARLVDVPCGQEIRVGKR